VPSHRRMRAFDRDATRGIQSTVSTERSTDPLSIPEIPRQAGWAALLRREYALIYCMGLLNKTGPFEVTLRDKLNNFSHLLSNQTLRKYLASNCLSAQQMVTAFRIERPPPITNSCFWTVGLQ
jgi:hypothetical protein